MIVNRVQVLVLQHVFFLGCSSPDSFRLNRSLHRRRCLPFLWYSLAFTADYRILCSEFRTFFPPLSVCSDVGISFQRKRIWTHLHFGWKVKHDVYPLINHSSHSLNCFILVLNYIWQKQQSITLLSWKCLLCIFLWPWTQINGNMAGYV